MAECRGRERLRNFTTFEVNLLLDLLTEDMVMKVESKSTRRRALIAKIELGRQGLSQKFVSGERLQVFYCHHQQCDRTRDI